MFVQAEDYQVHRQHGLMELAKQSEGLRILIGADSGLFGTSGVLMVVASARGDGRRIIPVVDCTARVIGRLLR